MERERSRFEALKARLEDQLRADIELLYEAHRAKLRAFETVWRTQAELDPSLEPPLPGTPAPPRRVLTLPAAPTAPGPSGTADTGEAWAVHNAVVELLPRLPELFDKNDVERALGFTPSRSTLFRALDDLQREGVITVEAAGRGRTPSKFRKVYTQGAAPVETPA
jgi:hypothetical protein